LSETQIAQAAIGADEFAIWLYWANVADSQMPPYLELCLETIRRQARDTRVIVVTPETLSIYLTTDDIPFDLARIEMRDPTKPAVALQADYIRVALLKKYGGLWVDIDCIMLKDPACLCRRLLETHDFVAMRKTSQRSQHVPVNFFASRRGGRIITAYKARIDEVVANKLAASEKFGWTDLGADPLTAIVNDNPSDVALLDEAMIHPFDFREKNLLQRVDPLFDLDGRLTEDTLCCMLFNSVFTIETRAMPREMVLTSGTLIGRMLRRALRESPTTRAASKLSYADVTIVFSTLHRLRETDDFLSSIRSELGGEIKIVFALQGTDDLDAYKASAERHKAQIELVPEDFGLAASRNFLFDKVETPLVFLCDDDFIFTPHTRLDVALDIMASDDGLDVLGGLVTNFNYREGETTAATQRLTAASYQFVDFPTLTAGAPVFYPAEYMRSGRRYHSPDFYVQPLSMVNNFALIRRSAFHDRHLRWDPEFKIMGEHEDFYLNNAVGPKCRVAFTNALYAEHHRRPTVQYKMLRERGNWHAHLFQKWRIHNLYFPGKRRETLRPDGTVKVMSIPR
jgi:hypothetical protein